MVDILREKMDSSVSTIALYWHMHFVVHACTFFDIFLLSEISFNRTKNSRCDLRIQARCHSLAFFQMIFKFSRNYTHDWTPVKSWIWYYYCTMSISDIISSNSSNGRLKGIQCLGFFSLVWRRYHCRVSNLTYTRHSYAWPLKIEDSLKRNASCDMGHPFMVISEGLNHSHLLQNVWKWSCHYLIRNIYKD